MSSLNASELASQLGLSKPRVSQYIAEGKLEGCYIGTGRARRFDLEKVKVALGRSLDPGQMLGNGAATKRALRDQPAPSLEGPAPRQRDGLLAANDPDRYELARIQNAEEDARRKRRDNERDEGRWVLAEEVERQTARAMQAEIAQFEGMLREGARALADELGVDYREARRVLMDKWRAHRGARVEVLEGQAEAAVMTEAEQASQG